MPSGVLRLGNTFECRVEFLIWDTAHDNSPDDGRNGNGACLTSLNLLKLDLETRHFAAFVSLQLCMCLLEDPDPDQIRSDPFSLTAARYFFFLNQSSLSCTKTFVFFVFLSRHLMILTFFLFINNNLGFCHELMWRIYFWNDCMWGALHQDVA